MADHASDSSSDVFDPLNVRREEEEGWEDVEPDYEPQTVVCLFCDHVFNDISSMLEHCRTENSFDLIKTRKELGV